MKPMGGEIWSSMPADPSERSQPDLVIYRFAGSLYYANAGFFFDEVMAFATSPDPARFICIDATAIPDVDYTGGETIRQLHDALADHDIRLAIAGAMEPVRHSLQRYGLTDLIGQARLFPTVSDALTRYRDVETGLGAGDDQSPPASDR
jgi:MFS superfamily sulfate permease-like transporter